MEPLLPQTSARDLALIVFKRKGSMLAIIAGTMLAFFGWLFLIHDDLYQTSAKILVKIGREQAPPPSVMGTPPLVIGYRSHDVNSEIAIFESGDSIGRVVDELHLDVPIVEPPPPGILARARYEFKRASRWTKDTYEEVLIRVGLRARLTPREKVIFGLRRGLIVQAEKDSNVFVASLLLPHREGAARVLNALLDHYLRLRQDLYRSRELDFFQAASDGAAARLHESERRLQAFEREGSIAQIDKQESLLLENIGAARVAWQEAEIARQEAVARTTRLQAELQKPDPNFASIGEFGREGFQQKALNDLADLQRQREQLRMTELDSGTRIRNNRQQFDALAAMLQANLKTALAEAEQQATLRRATYDRLQAHVQQLHQRQMTWDDLKRQTVDNENTYRVYRRKLDEAAAEDAMQARQIGNVAVIERASDPIAPTGVSKTALLSIALLGALLAAMAWVTMAEFFDHRVYTVEQLQRYVPARVLAVIPPGLRTEAH